MPALISSVHVRAPVAGQQRLRARGLDLGDVGREVLDLAERDQLVADHLHVGPELGEEGLHVALHRLAEQIVLVQQVDLGDVLRAARGPSTSAFMPTCASKRKCQKLHFSLVSSVATAPQLM